MSEESPLSLVSGDTYESLRPQLFALAYRMLGSASDAEDVVQEAFLRLRRSEAQGVAVESPQAFLKTVVTRLAIDALRSARARRESYFGPWLPEPWLVSTEPDPAERVERADSLALSFLVLLETLTPVERAVFLLREVFDYEYEEIARIVEKSEANCRQIFARARRHIDERRPRFRPTREEQAALSERFLGAVESGELDGLVELLAADAAFYGDGGGKARGLPRPVFGRDRVHRLLVGFLPMYGELGLRARRAWVNGEPGLVFLDAEGRLISVWALEVADGAIRAIRSVINPDKLAHLGRPLSPLSRVGAALGPRDRPADGVSGP